MKRITNYEEMLKVNVECVPNAFRNTDFWFYPNQDLRGTTGTINNARNPIEEDFMNDARNFICRREDGNIHRHQLSNPLGLKIKRRRHCTSKDILVSYEITSKNGKVLRFKFNQQTSEFIGLTKSPWKYKTLLEVAGAYATCTGAELILMDNGRYAVKGRIYNERRVEEGAQAEIRNIQWIRNGYVKTTKSLFRLAR